MDAGGAVRSSLLLELDPAGRFSHLELSTAAGLLTLHPESDGALHGNALTASGIEHVRGRPWDPDRAVWLDGSPVSAAAARRGDGSWATSILRIGLDLGLTDVQAPADAELADDDGLPRLDRGTTWPLDESD